MPYSRTLLFTHFICESLHLLTPNSTGEWFWSGLWAGFNLPPAMLPHMNTMPRLWSRSFFGHVGAIWVAMAFCLSCPPPGAWHTPWGQAAVGPLFPLLLLQLSPVPVRRLPALPAPRGIGSLAKARTCLPHQRHARVQEGSGGGQTDFKVWGLVKQRWLWCSGSYWASGSYCFWRPLKDTQKSLCCNECYMKSTYQ